MSIFFRKYLTNLTQIRGPNTLTESAYERGRGLLQWFPKDLPWHMSNLVLHTTSLEHSPVHKSFSGYPDHDRSQSLPIVYWFHSFSTEKRRRWRDLRARFGREFQKPPVKEGRECPRITKQTIMRYEDMKWELLSSWQHHFRNEIPSIRGPRIARDIIPQQKFSS